MDYIFLSNYLAPAMISLCRMPERWEVKSGKISVKPQESTIDIMGMYNLFHSFVVFWKNLVAWWSHTSVCPSYCIEDGTVKPKMADEVKYGLPSDSVETLTGEAQKQFERFVSGAHQMTACALAAIEACSADVPQTAHLLELLVLTPSPLLQSIRFSLKFSAQNL